MLVTWERTWPRWPSVGCALFGLMNIIGALAGPAELWVPGVVIGSVWAAIGLKGGLPLFESVPRGVVPGTERIPRGLRIIRRRRIVALLSPLIWLPIAAIILSRVPEKLLATVLLLSALPLGAVVAIW